MHWLAGFASFANAANYGSNCSWGKYSYHKAPNVQKMRGRIKKWIAGDVATHS